MKLPPARRFLLAAAVLIGYVFVSRLLLGSPVFRQSVLWLPTGVAVAGLWILGISWWPVVTLATVLHRVSIHYPLSVYWLAALGNTLEAVVAVALLRRFGFRQDFGRLRDVLALLVAAVIGPAVSATIGRTRALTHPDSLTLFEGWAGWWRMNLLGVLVVSPLILTWTSRPPTRPRMRTLIETLGFSAAVLALIWFLISVDPAQEQSGMVLSYLAVPVTLYAAVRFGVRGASTSAAAVVLFLAVGSSYGLGPFVGRAATTPIAVRELALQALIGIVTVTPLLLAAVISEREEAQAAIVREREQREELLASINRNIGEGLFRSQPGRGLVYANSAFARLLGYDSPDELLGQPFTGLLASPLWRQAGGRGFDPEESLLGEEVLFVRKDGSEMPGLLSYTVVRDPDGGLRYCDGAIVDLASRKRLEEQLRQAQKMEALGKLAGGVAHDFNNLLMVIGGYAELLRSKLPAGTPARNDAEEISRATNRAASLTGQLLAYSRRQRLELQVLDFGEVVEQSTGMLRRLIGEDIRLLARREEGESRVKGDRGQLDQVILNLALNARDAMPRGGVLSLTTSRLEVPPGSTSVPPDVPPGSYVLLSVQDNGVGMDTEVRSRAFDPFFTTKEQGKGTGLGLSTVYGIVRQCDGYVWLESHPGAGTVARVCLPRVPRGASAPAIEPAPPRNHPATGSVLIVEDEPGVRRLVSETLREAGYGVFVAEDGEQGLLVAQRAGARLDLVITDVVMPRLGGREMVIRLRARQPDIRVLYISGYSSEALDPVELMQQGAEYLQKPFTPALLRERVGAILKRPAGSPSGA